MRNLSTSLVLFGLVFALPAGCSRAHTVQKTDTIMGTRVSVTVVAESRREGEAAVDAALEEIRRYDRMLSLYKGDSELTQVNKAAGLRPVPVSPELIRCVEAGIRASEITHGAFDATIGPLSVLWQMRLKEGTTPTDREIAEVRQRVGYRNVVIDKKASTVFLKRRNMILDLGGVAKGFVADAVAVLLEQRGIRNGIVALAGDIRVLGLRDDGLAWRIGVQHPRDPEQTLTVLELSDKSISTSGDYERFTIVQGKRYHHIIDPRTGRPSSGVMAVTVVGEKGELVDPLTTALFILGPREGGNIVRRLGCEALFVDEQGTVTATAGITLPERLRQPAAQAGKRPFGS